jgi:hypothetical protein
MLDTFKLRLKAKLKTLGVNNLSQKRIDAIADRLHKKFPDITEETDHDTRIDEFHELQPLDEIAKTDDQIRTLEAKAKPKPKENAKPADETPDDQDTPEKGDETPGWAKKMFEKIEKLEKEKTQSSMQTTIAGKLKDKVPATYYAKRALPEKDEDLDAWITEVETDYTAFKQELVNQGFVNTGKPAGGGETGVVKTTGKEDADIDAWASKGKPAAKEAVKK